MMASVAEDVSMEAATLRPFHALPTALPASPPGDYAWVYDDPDLMPFLARPRVRPELPLSAFA